ncbi:MAG: PHP domain-containing protein [Bacteroidota bacterium]
MKPILNRIIPHSGHIGLFTLMMLMAILSTVFHQPIQIIDALTSAPVPGFGIHISVWRVLFEPFTGPLLFYLRADQPVLEFTVLLIWILAIYLVVTLGRLFLKNIEPRSKKERSGKLKLAGLLNWLKTVPLIVATWLGLLWLIIYIPLPANRIVNQQENTILINTHSHTEYSHDGIISTKGLLKWHKKNGFDAFFITDHNHHQKTMEAVTAQDQGLLPATPLLMVGEEFSGSNHMTLLGLNRSFITRGLTDQQVIDSTHDDNGVVIVAHWFDGERESIPFFLDMGVDGFEIANQADGLTYDRRIFRNITEACITNGLMMNGAADYHGYGSSCFVWNALKIPGWHQMDNEGQRESILDLFRQRDMSRIRVLLYRDRNTFDRSRVFWSPLYTTVSYFRTLNLLQLLSWFFWLVLLAILRSRLKNRLDRNISLRTMQALALASSVFLLANGAVLNLKARSLTEYNDIYTEYSNIMLLCGAGFLTYTLILIIIEHKKGYSRNR